MFKDITSQRFGRLLVVVRAPNYANGKARFHCLCECGTVKVISGQSLRRGLTKSCGCFRIELPSTTKRTHGKSHTPEYRAWMRMIDRCENPNSKFYHRYGGRGISVFPAWRTSFQAFFDDMGPRPSSAHSLDRKENDGDYTPNNCQWGTADQQAFNRSGVKFFTLDGVTDSMAGWARRTGIPYGRLRRRIVDGWTITRALEKEVL